MPPLALRDGATLGVTIDPDEKHIIVRQSWLNTYMDCPERARRYAARIDIDPPNDASGVGTAFHYAIELAVNALIDGKPAHTVDDMLQAFHYQFDLLCEFGEHDVPMRWVKRTDRQARLYGEDMIGRFHASVYPHLDPIATEVGFGPELLGVSDDGWCVSAQGSIDCVDRNLGLVDWKSASQTYKAWEKRRWAVQPTVYLRAADAAQLLPEFLYPPIFTYMVFPDTQKEADRIQLLQVTRADTQTAWVVDQVASIARMISALGFDTPWPKRDQHALCSAKWCPSWSSCKGKFLGDDPVDWAQPEPRLNVRDLPRFGSLT